MSILPVSILLNQPPLDHEGFAAHRELEARLKSTLRGDVLFDLGSRALYAADASNYRQMPVGVITPRDAADVEAALAACRATGAAVLPRGAGTSLAGQCANVAVVFDYSRYMRELMSIDPEAKLAIVQPGIVLDRVREAAEVYHLTYAPDPATHSRCTLGGMIGNNSCGVHGLLGGKTVDNVERMDIMLYDGTRMTVGRTSEEEIRALISSGGRVGEIYARLVQLRDRYAGLIREKFPRIPRRVSGYNLDELLPENGFNLARSIAGSEGTLGIILKVTLEVVPKPKMLVLVVMGFDDIYSAADQVPWILEHRPEALEAFDHALVDFAREKKIPAINLLPDGRAFLIAEVGGGDSDEAGDRGNALMERARRIPGCAALMLTDARERNAVWALRGSGLGASAFIKGRPRTWPGAEDTAVAPARLGSYLRRLVRLLDRRGLLAASYYGHFGEGCVHCRINFDFMTTRGIANFRATMFDLADLVAEFGGSLSGEHGDGIARSELLPKIFGADLIDAFGEFKRIFDPDGLMNPGVIVAPEPIDSHLRVSPLASAPPLPTHFDFSAENGLAGAAMKCVGIGKCRKLDGGTMCPSYMATRDETHSTRGRAHLLFEALTTGAHGFDDPALGDALDLCLSCKACKTECPAGVDMAAYKAEFLANHYQMARRPLSSIFFGRIADIAKAASHTPRLARALSSGAMAHIARRALGIHRERRLPVFAPQSFASFMRGRTPANPDGPEVVLFPDTFTNFFEPAVALAALRLLERAGQRVIVPATPICCGRPMYDQGILDRARRVVGAAAATLAPYARRGVPIVGLEPSCILTFRDELPALFPAEPDSAVLARGTMTFGEFVASQPEMQMPSALDADVLLHGHCHQKALVGLGNETALLGRIGNVRLSVPGSGCCGMAGAFGYDERHYEVSRLIGERVLFPAVRARAPGTVVVADGFACRNQIRQFCPDVRPIHLAQLLEL